jgi:hypothetical protein
MKAHSAAIPAAVISAGGALNPARGAESSAADTKALPPIDGEIPE